MQSKKTKLLIKYFFLYLKISDCTDRKKMQKNGLKNFQKYFASKLVVDQNYHK